jgi:3-methyl-2-oxobutanoate hydroxymethyltransferase
MKDENRPVSMITCYDYTFAKIVAKTDVDAVLIGDSLGNVIAGYDTTLPVTVDDIIYHSRAVKRGAPDVFIVADLPFLSYQVSVEDAVRNAGRIMKETGVNAVKLEGGADFADTIRALVRASIPVMGHLGLTPQSVHTLGGYRVQGKTPEDAKRIIDDAKAVEDAGAFALVLEMVPEELAKRITESLSIPTIGIGAGRHCSGQVLVLQDALGMDNEYKKKYLKKYAQIESIVQTALNSYNDDVKKRIFPAEEHSFTAK